MKNLINEVFEKKKNALELKNLEKIISRPICKQCRFKHNAPNIQCEKCGLSENTGYQASYSTLKAIIDSLKCCGNCGVVGTPEMYDCEPGITICRKWRMK